MKHRNILLLVLCMIVALLLSACGSSSESTATSASEEVVSEESAEEEEAIEEEDSAEEEEEEEEVELTVDETFALLVEDGEGICMKLQIYNQKGTPVRSGIITLECDSNTIEEETDSSGYALITGLMLDTEYTVTVVNSSEELIGTVTLMIIDGDTYAAAVNDDDTLVVSVADGEISVVDLSISATDENGEDSAFECHRIDIWDGDATPSVITVSESTDIADDAEAADEETDEEELKDASQEDSEESEDSKEAE